MNYEDSCDSVLSESFPGPIGVGLWRSPLKQLPKPPWGPRQNYATLSGGKSSHGFRNLWVLGGDAGRPMNDIWRSVDGGCSWDMVEAGPHWCPRSRLSACGAATDPKKDTRGRPIGIMYVVGGQTHSGLFGDVWASDTAGRTWHCINDRTPFGPRADMASVVVPPNPMHLLVGGGMSSDLHRDLWLSYDAGETFSPVDIQSIPLGFSLVQWPPQLLCAARSPVRGRLALWSLEVSWVTPEGSDVQCARAVLEPLDDHADFQTGFENRVPRPPSVSIDLELQIALSFDAYHSRLVAYPLQGSRCAEPFILSDVRSASGQETNFRPDVHIHCDMDAANFGWEFLRHGCIWIVSSVGEGVWVTDRSRFRAQDRLLKIIGAHLADSVGFPWELWSSRVRAFLLPFRTSCGPEITYGTPLTSWWKVVHKPRVAVRAKPSVSGEIVAAAVCGTEFKPVEVQGDWFRIEGELSGWILSDGRSLGLGKLLERIL